MIIRLILSISLLGVSIAQDDLIVKTSYGSIQGYETASSDGTRVRVFKAIPFAAPPVGDLRWKLPEAPKTWVGVRDGRKYSAACMSNSTTSSSLQPWVDEDCLYLNVFMHGECTAEKKCPIIVYFHGGNMNYDSATYFNDTALIETYAAKGIMLVIPAFRLGFTGQFTLGDDQELVPSNLGIHDAILGLKFIKKEAAAFGGDSEAITLMGHSSGAGLAIMLAFSPYARAQVAVHQYIAMSSGIYFENPESNQNLTKKMIKIAGCKKVSKKHTLACMKEKTGQELLAIQRSIEEETTGNVVFGGVLMRPPLFPFSSYPEVYEHPPSGNMLIGATNAEMDFPPTPFTAHGQRLGDLTGAKNVQELDELYYNLVESGKTNQTHMPQSQQTYAGIYLAAQALRDSGKKAFVYSFDMPTHNHHAEDLSYFMGIHPFEKNEHEQVIATIYPQLLINFTKYGEPSPEWKPFDTHDSYFSIAVNLTTGRMPEMHENYEKETIDFWIRKAPKIDKMITVAKAGGAKLEWDKVTGGFRDLIIEDDSTPVRNETLIPIVLVHTSYFPSLLLVGAVFLLGLFLGRHLLSDSSSRDERIWILGPDGRGMRVEAGKVPAYAEQMF